MGRPIIDSFRAWSHLSLCHKEPAKGKKAPSRGLWVPWAGSLWHKRADVASLSTPRKWSPHWPGLVLRTWCGGDLGWSAPSSQLSWNQHLHRLSQYEASQKSRKTPLSLWTFYFYLWIRNSIWSTFGSWYSWNSPFSSWNRNLAFLNDPIFSLLSSLA